MNQQEINNFTRMADALEEEIFRLRKDLNESETLVDVLQRELHDARQELKIAHLEKDILRLEKLALENRLKELEESLFREEEFVIIAKLDFHEECFDKLHDIVNTIEYKYNECAGEVLGVLKRAKEIDDDNC